jgi:hypothetical protein
MDELDQSRIEVERELTVRRAVYPRLIEQGKLTQGEADRRMRALRHVLYLLDRVPDLPTTHTPPTTV